MLNLKKVMLLATVGLAAALVPLGVAAAELRAFEGAVFSDFSPGGTEMLMGDYQSGELWLHSFTTHESRLISSLKDPGETQQTHILAPRFSADGKTLAYLSVKEGAAAAGEPQMGLIWRTQEEGGAFKTLGQVRFSAHENPLPASQFFQFFPDGRRLILRSYDAQRKTPALFALDPVLNQWGDYVWQTGVLSFRFSPDFKFVAYLVQENSAPSAGGKNFDPLNPLTIDLGASAHQNFALWITRSDGGQLKKSSEKIYIPSGIETDVGYEWAPNSRWIAYFSERADENFRQYRELQIQKPGESKSYVTLSTWGLPLGPPRWANREDRLAFLEQEGSVAGKTEGAGEPAIHLVTLGLKLKNGAFQERHSTRTVNVPAHTEFLGFDPKDNDYVYLLVPQKGKNEAYFSLVKQAYDKDRGITVARYIPNEVYYWFDHLREQFIFCHKAAGCQVIGLSGGEPFWLTPNFSTTVGAGDFLTRAGDFSGAQKIYSSISPKFLERPMWLSVLARLYVSFKLGGKAEEGQKIWHFLLDKVDKGENPAGEYLALGETFYQLGESRQAVDLLQKVQSEHPGTLEARKALLKSGAIYIQLGDYNFGRNCFANFAKLYADDPQAPLALVQLGESYLALDEPGIALKVFRKIINLARGDNLWVRATLGKAKALEKMNRFQEAIKTYELVLKQYDDSAKGSLEMLDAKYLEEARVASKNLSQHL